MTHEQWLAERKLGIGGTDISAIMGLNPWRSPHDVWLDKTGRSEPTEENVYMQRGKQLEPIVKDIFEMETGFDVFEPAETVFTDKDNAIFKASLDFVYSNGKYGVLECKTASYDVLDPHLHYILQVQWYMGITGYEQGCIAYLIRGLDFKYFNIHRDNDLITLMREKAEEFWNNYVLTDTPPPPQNREDVIKMFEKTQPTAIDADSEIMTAYEKLIEIKASIKELQKQEEELKEAIQLRMLDNEAVIDNFNNTIITWKQSTRTTFDSKLFQQEQPELYQQFLKESKTRTFLVKQVK